MKNRAELDHLVEILTRGCFMTAAQIAVEQSCSKVCAYRRVQQLKSLGFRLQTCELREGAAGPLSLAYAVVGAPPRSRTALMSV